MNIDDDVLIDNERKAKIVFQLGKETGNPNEEDWYEVKFENGSTDHYPESRISKYKLKIN
jgi:hypothetical protein